MGESLQMKGLLRGHNGWVNQIATNPKYPDMILSSSRGEYNKLMPSSILFVFRLYICM